MGELTIEIRYEREDGVYGIDVEAHRDGEDIELEVAYDEQFCNLLCDLGKRFTEIVDKLNAEELK